MDKNNGSDVNDAIKKLGWDQVQNIISLLKAEEAYEGSVLKITSLMADLPIEKQVEIHKAICGIVAIVIEKAIIVSTSDIKNFSIMISTMMNSSIVRSN